MELAELERLQLEYTEKTKRIRVAVRRDYRAVTNAQERMEIEEKRLEIREQQLRTIERVLDEVTFDIPGYQGLTFNDAFQAQAQFTEAQRVFYQARRNYAAAKENSEKQWNGLNSLLVNSCQYGFFTKKTFQFSVNYTLDNFD